MSKRREEAANRTPAYVSREIGAYELCISVTTWDEWVRDGYLPPPVRLGTSPRWRWADVDAVLAGKTITKEPEPYFREIDFGKTEDRRRSAPARRSGNP